MHFLSPVLAGVLLVLALAQPSRATLVAYEGFDYPPGVTVAGLAGGVGWTNPWTAGATANYLATNTPGSLLYTDANGLSLQTNGGSLVVGNPAGTTATTATPNRVLDFNLSRGTGTAAGPGGTVWISFLYKRLNFAPGALPYLRQANLGLFEGSGERAACGGPNTSATVSNVLSAWGIGAHSSSSPFQSPAHPLTEGTTYFILMKIAADGTSGADVAHLWFNWTNLLMEPAPATATLVQNEVNLSGVNTLRFQAGNQNASGSNAVFQVDELRVGTTFADVTPTMETRVGPSITFHPADQTVTLGTRGTFSVTASGSVPLHYQWYFNTNTPVGEDANQLVLPAVTPDDAGAYHVVITNSVGAITSSAARLTVVPPSPPDITTAPANQTVVLGETATFAVIASGTAPLHYQWCFNGNTLMNQTNAVLTLPDVSSNDAGGYAVVVTNLHGADTSSVATLTVLPVFERLPAFPGADGAARHVTGGRGGLVYRVTRLDRNYSDTQPGTLRFGLTDANFPAGVPRTIVFAVAGVFWLGRHGAERPEYDNGWDTQSRYTIPDNLTLAGQTAPGPVIIMGGVTKANGRNLILRNITFAPGYGMKTFNEPDSLPPRTPTPGDFPDAIVYDALDVSGQNIMLDHLTMVYATDETVSCNERAANLTIQYCNISQGQNYPQADAERPGVYTGHALGSLLQAGSNARISVLHNLYAHQKGRLPRVGSEVGTGAFNDFRNNVFYNWIGTAGTGANGQPSFNNFINNFYLAGPGGDDVSGPHIVNAVGGTGIFSGDSGPATRAYVSGNLKDTNKNGSPADAGSADESFNSILAQPTSYDVNLGLTLNAAAAFTNTLHHAGARWWARRYDFALGNTNAISTNDIPVHVDERLIHETFTGTGRIVAWADDPFDDSPTEGWEWRRLLALRADPNTGAAPYARPASWDSDGDGLPNDWELEHGLDPNAADPNGDFDRDGYTDLEEHLNELAAWPAPGILVFHEATNNRYAEIFNWSVRGAVVNIAGTNTVTTSKWQPSRYDAALISNRTCVVDAPGQHAGRLRLTDGAVLAITQGWLNVADALENDSGCTLTVRSTAHLRVTNNLENSGVLRLTGNAGLFVGGRFTNTGTLDLLTWSGTLPDGFANTDTVLDRSLLRLSGCRLSGGDVEVEMPGCPGHTYQLQYHDALPGADWQNAGPVIPGTGSPLKLRHAGGAMGAQRFYRVTVDP